MAYRVKNADGKHVQRDGKDVLGSDIVSIVKEVNIDKRILTMTGTTEGKDRDGDVIMLKGWDLINYLKNPVFLWSHDYRSVPMAAATKVVRRRNPAQMDFTLKFPSMGLHPFADMILELYNEKIINASSVGFIPREWEPLEKDSDGSAAHVLRGRRYLKQELLELSGCAVPSNPEALQNSIKSIAPDMQKFFDLGQVPDPDKKDDVLGELEQIKSTVQIEEETGVAVQVPVTYNVQDDAKAIGGAKSLPLDAGVSWDAVAAEKRVRAWADGDWAKYRTAFVWYDAANPEKFGSYKLLFTDIFGGDTLKAKWGGVMRAMGAVLGARGGISISDADRKKAYAFLSGYYKKFSKPVPVYHIFNGADEKALEELFAIIDKDFNLEIAELNANLEKYEKQGVVSQSVDQGEPIGRTKDSANIYEHILNPVVDDRKKYNLAPLIDELSKLTAMLNTL